MNVTGYHFITIIIMDIQYSIINHGCVVVELYTINECPFPIISSPFCGCNEFQFWLQYLEFVIVVVMNKMNNNSNDKLIQYNMEHPNHLDFILMLNNHWNLITSLINHCVKLNLTNTK